MRYELLGPLSVTENGITSFFGPRKVEILLALLLSRRDQVVPAEALIAGLWGDRPPRRAAAAIHVYVSQLRKFLARPDGATPIVTRQPGYMLCIGEDVVDVDEFQALVREGRTWARDGRHEAALERFDAALALWRGPALTNLRDCPSVQVIATWLEELRLECLEMQMDSALALGRHREAVGRLHALTAEHPLSEVFCRQLMLALYRSHRQADALEAYRRIRRTLRAELGLEPCGALRDLHEAILTSSRRLERLAV